MEVSRLTGAIEAEIIGGDVTNDADWPEIRQAFIDHAVIVIRAQDISADVHISFASCWGQINKNRFFTPHSDAPNIALALKEADHT
ncbi:MAG: TauD/TfdA family dioxygenase [Rhodobacterales bacterium]